MADNPLQKAPIGLLGAFDLKTLGFNPGAFGGTITPTVDVFDNYLLLGNLQASLQAVTLGLGASVVSSTFTVPVRKCWRVLGVGAETTLNAGDTAKVLSLGLTADLSTSGLVFVLGVTPMLGEIQLRWGGLYLPRPLLLGPSAQLFPTIFVNAALGAAATFTRTYVLFQEFDA